MGAGSSSVNSELKKYVDAASPEDMASAAERLDEEDKARLLAALQESDWQHALLFYQEGGADPEAPEENSSCSSR